MINRLLFIFGLGLLVIYGSKAQTLYIQDSAVVFVGDSAIVNSTGSAENNGRIENNNQFIVDGDIQNQGDFFNLGNISLSGDWVNSGMYNGTMGGFTMTGDDMQRVFNNDLLISELIINSNDTVVLEGNMVEVEDLIDFRSGVLKTAGSNQLIIDNTADVRVPTPGSSYFEGRLILEGGSELTDAPDETDTQFKLFPLGANGRYAPITFSSIQENDFYQLAVTFITPNSRVPEPDSTLIGVSDESLYHVEVVTPGIESALVEVGFVDENLDESSFTLINPINADIKSPVVAIATAPEGPFTTLGGDTLTFETIISEEELFLADGIDKYVAVALAPRIPDHVDVFIPEAFSPVASDPINRALRVFGIGIREDNFRMVVFNRYNNVVYETTELNEATSIGWDGRLKNGNDAPRGLYFCVVNLLRENGTPEGLPESYKKPVYLVR